MVADILSVLHDFWRERIFVFGYVVEFFKHREVAVTLNVTHRSRVPIPIPGTAEISAAFNDPDVFKPADVRP